MHGISDKEKRQLKACKNCVEQECGDCTKAINIRLRLQALLRLSESRKAITENEITEAIKKIQLALNALGGLQNLKYKLKPEVNITVGKTLKNLNT